MRSFLLIACGLSLGFAPAGEDDLCVRCHGNAPATAPTRTGPEAPLLVERYSMSWEMFEFEGDARPPVATVPTPNQVIHGTTYYDWARRSMTEIYRERCIDIFPGGRDFPCQFTSVGDRTYFIEYARFEPKVVKSCCQWRQTAFWAPRPDVLRNMSFDREQPYGTRDAQWWTLDAPMPGPFGYGLAQGRPVAFWFPVISGWVQQVFHDYSRKLLPADAFALPAECNVAALPVCND